MESWSSTTYLLYGVDLEVKSTPIQSNKITGELTAGGSAVRRLHTSLPAQPHRKKAAQLSDKVLHVVSGLQVAGFEHVIGCLWPSDDKTCVAVAKLFYNELSQGGASALIYIQY